VQTPKNARDVLPRKRLPKVQETKQNLPTRIAKNFLNDEAVGAAWEAACQGEAHDWARRVV
jgi:hypothetical protein